MTRGEDEIVELVNAVVDGEATAEEQAELEHLLATSPHARELFDLTRDIARRLEAMRTFDPPAELRKSIIDSVERRASARRRRTEPLRFTRRRVFTLAWAAAAAIVLVFVIVGHHPMTDTGATMARAGALHWAEVARVPSQRGTLVVRRQGDLYSIEPVFNGPHPLTISMGWDPSNVTLIGVSDEKDASFGKASVKFTLRDPSQRAVVIVRPRTGASAAPIWVSVGTAEVGRSVVPFR